jgi:hypothetical protein
MLKILELLWAEPSPFIENGEKATVSNENAKSIPSIIDYVPNKLVQWNIKHSKME